MQGKKEGGGGVRKQQTNGKEMREGEVRVKMGEPLVIIKCWVK